MIRLLRRLNFALRVLFVNDPTINTGRQLTGWGWRLGLSFEQSRPFVHLWKNLKQPWRAIRHKRLASRISSAAMTRGHVHTLSEGYAAFSVDDIPNGPAVADLLIKLWRERCLGSYCDPEMLWRQNGTDYHALRNCLKADDLLRYPEVGDFILSDLFLALATNYLGSVPRLSSVQLWWTTANETRKASQLYHMDTEDARQLKIFVNLSEVSAENGPFTFLPISKSNTLRKILNYRGGRLQDEKIRQHFSSNQEVHFIGGIGSGMAVDTSGCIHYGSRTRVGDRLMLMIQYVPFNVQRECNSPPPLLDEKRYVNDPVRSLIVKTSQNG